jgi:predicted DNA-binding transcriptional regulator YafY
MRYEKADNLLQLALDMQAARTGLSLLDIQERYGVGRRTAQRMRDAIMRIFPQAEEVPTDERTKRWRIPAGVLDRLIDFDADELADLEAAISLCRRENLPEQAARLSSLAAKLKAMMKPDVARRVEPDLEALLEAEGLSPRGVGRVLGRTPFCRTRIPGATDRRQRRTGGHQVGQRAPRGRPSHAPLRRQLR